MTFWPKKRRSQSRRTQAYERNPHSHFYQLFTILPYHFPGWESLDPFIPIEVTKYTEEELDSMIDYYVEKGQVDWLAFPAKAHFPPVCFFLCSTES